MRHAEPVLGLLTNLVSEELKALQEMVTQETRERECTVH